MRDLEVGQVVFSKCGRDYGKAFIVVSLEEEYAYLADGDLRLLEKPKRKKYKHIQRTDEVIQRLKQKLIEENVLDAEIRKELKAYLIKTSI
ncbi:KOW domain-containing RNA-binding protein [Niameybacter sp.]|uniref:KOW domain-containing RNA-binding protein n=1 Tax=Niameybacter sp. TaxID=2033640 RepID=UPI002FC73D34